MNKKNQPPPPKKDEETKRASQKPKVDEAQIARQTTAPGKARSK